jgi:hypothetical protein
MTVFKEHEYKVVTFPCSSPEQFVHVRTQLESAGWVIVSATYPPSLKDTCAALIFRLNAFNAWNPGNT